MIGLDYPFLMGDKRLFKKAFKNVNVIDSKGLLYKVNRVEQMGGILPWYSIKFMGLMVRLNPICEKEPSQISLGELKSRVSNHVEQNKRFWSPLNDGRGLKTMIKEALTFEELIKMFR